MSGEGFVVGGGIDSFRSIRYRMPHLTFSLLEAHSSFNCNWGALTIASSLRNNMTSPRRVLILRTTMGHFWSWQGTWA